MRRRKTGLPMTFMSRLSSLGPSEADIRAEIWKLGARHRGEPLAGALDELKAPQVPAGRSVLLRACVETLRAR
ncbi:MAG: hypothetical protein BGN86_05495 [Caulobacterales bacterium 68-7]|nr:MAG: hypothetical protein BGN86_05495 [Caulobacterales bacterium 68-7]